MPEQNWSGSSGWGLLVIVGYPLLTLILSEWSRREAAVGKTGFLRLLGVLQTLLLPILAIWLVLTKLAGFPKDSLLAKSADTAIGIAVLYTLFVLVQGVVALLAARTKAPRLLYDIALSILVSIGGAVILSHVWGLDLSHLLSAVGVGSVVIGLALQGVMGGMVSGLLLLSARQFTIGDFLNVGPGKAGLVRQIDWRSVTLQVSKTERLVLPSASLAAASFCITDPTKSAELSVTVTIGYEHSPETVCAMLLNVARSVPQLVAPDEVRCMIAEFEAGGIQYTVYIPVLHPGKFAVAQGEFLSRLWYAAQRHGISIGNLPVYEQTEEERFALLTAAGAFQHSPSLLAELAKIGRIERWRSEEKVLAVGETPNAVLVMLRGSIKVYAQFYSEQIELEHLGAGQVFAIREGFRGMPSPVLAVVDEETELLAFPIPAMQLLFNSDPGFASDMEIILETRAKALQKLSTDDGKIA
ncbi:mechanosensitive ion channel [Candidatus Methylospira mobilis]|uniref:Mechanosensitive ion channel n=1 Tax=Candidatus Methylospira mobilis TaxID=1808979 RepID=A0A5Q0BLQ9_9GAMM|nr:mechanosensitive ion channel family protein [Candidatus Methylospira mobilis]QFY44865.1 mechanosensitive ion channel [Candidatus Methylospira mobilis]WNV05591.1 mechanosensitive ion channel family protein [Candidatus Methylospira mobilis]